jgi:thymidylate kinase
MKAKLIILDGARGAGKSTVSNLLKEKMENTAFVGLDLVRNLITKSKATDEYNVIAFDVIFSLTESFLSNGVSIVIDSGITKERDKKLKEIVTKCNVPFFMYYLSAPKDVLWERIQKRGEERNKMPNRERFDYTYEMQQSKDFSAFVEIDTTKNSPEKIAEQVYNEVISQ